MDTKLTQEKQIKKMPAQKSKKILEMSSEERADIEGFINALQAAGMDEFMEYIRSPWKMLWPNFVAGVARGFGALVGVTIVITLIGWTLSQIIDIPLIGKKLEPYVELVQTEFNKYTEATNYNDNFERMEATLESIDNSLKK